MFYIVSQHFQMATGMPIMQPQQPPGSPGSPPHYVAAGEADNGQPIFIHVNLPMGQAPVAQHPNLPKMPTFNVGDDCSSTKPKSTLIWLISTMSRIELTA